MNHILEIKQVQKTYADGTPALAGVSFNATKAKTLGLVGESGSGKSTLARAIMGLEPVDSGEILFKGQDITAMNAKKLRQTRFDMQMVFQNPRAAFNDRMSIRASLLEPLQARPGDAKEILNGASMEDFAAQWMRQVHLDPQLLDRYPRALSGGQLQRVAIARALSTNVELVVLDEPTASLDVSVQASVLNLLKDLQASLDTTFVFISHDLAAVRFLADDIVVMRHGKVVDTCAADAITDANRSDYTRQLVGLFR